MKSIEKELVAILETALEDARFDSTKGKIMAMLRRAKAGEYKEDKPLLSLELRTIGMYEVAKEVDDGGFDGLLEDAKRALKVRI